MRVSLHKAWTKAQERTGGSQIHITSGNPSINSKATTFRETLVPLVPFLHSSEMAQCLSQVDLNISNTSQKRWRKNCCLCFTRGCGSPRMVLAHSSPHRRSGLGCRSHAACPSTAPGDPGGPEPSLLKGTTCTSQVGTRTSWHKRQCRKTCPLFDGCMSTGASPSESVSLAWTEN